MTLCKDVVAIMAEILQFKAQFGTCSTRMRTQMVEEETQCSSIFLWLWNGGKVNIWQWMFQAELSELVPCQSSGILFEVQNIYLLSYRSKTGARKDHCSFFWDHIALQCKEQQTMNEQIRGSTPSSKYSSHSVDHSALIRYKYWNQMLLLISRE